MPTLPMLLQRLLRLLGRGPASARAAAPGATPSSAADTAATPAGAAPWSVPDVEAGRGAHLRWLLTLPLTTARPPGAAVERLLGALDAALATSDSCARLLRRAPNVVPRLIQTLRSDVYTRAEVAGQIERDAVLLAEVLRAARSVLYAHHHRGSPSVAQAVGLLGSDGLRQVVARVLLRPLFRADGTGLQARATPRLWDESERCAALCVALARDQGVDPVDAYLAGLLQNIGWSAMLHAIDLRGLAPLLHPALLDEPAFVVALGARRARVLDLLLPSWDISPALNALAAGEAPALRAVVAQAQDLLVLRRMQADGRVPGGLAAPAGCPPWLAAVYLG